LWPISLGTAILGFASGNRIVGDLDMEGAPLEIRQLAAAYDRMTDTILRDEAELEDLLHHKEVLLREVHHRVKNNLQLIASIMNLQARQARTPEAKELMRGLQERVMSLATIHRGLYQTTGLGDISAAELFPDIVNQILKLGTGPGHRFDVSTEVDDIRLTPDQAVPLALLLTEAMTNALKYAGSETGTPWIRVSLSHPAGESGAELRIANSLGPRAAGSDVSTEEGSGLGTQLLRAFVQQIEGTQSVTESDGVYDLRVRFSLRPLNEAEARFDERARERGAGQ
jgi:two-component sensor histidine kinase